LLTGVRSSFADTTRISSDDTSLMVKWRENHVVGNLDDLTIASHSTRLHQYLIVGFCFPFMPGALADQLGDRLVGR